MSGAGSPSCRPGSVQLNLFKYIFFCFILVFTSSSPCRKDQFAISFFFFKLSFVFLRGLVLTALKIHPNLYGDVTFVTVLSTDLRKHLGRKT